MYSTIFGQRKKQRFLRMINVLLCKGNAISSQNIKMVLERIILFTRKHKYMVYILNSQPLIRPHISHYY